jgi:hypothetical protein
LAFSEDGGTLYALEAASQVLNGTNQILELNLSSFATQTWPLPTEDAVAIKAARNASKLEVLYVAGRADRVLLAIDRSTHQPTASVTLPVEPSTIESLGNNSFLISSRSSVSEPLWSFTSGSPSGLQATLPTVYFVPATPLPNSLGTSREVRPK